MLPLELEALADCTACTQGRYCDTPGLTTSRGPCDAGFICVLGAISSSPTDGVTGERCPAGGYCVSGKLYHSVYWFARDAF